MGFNYHYKNSVLRHESASRLVQLLLVVQECPLLLQWFSACRLGF